MSDFRKGCLSMDGIRVEYYFDVKEGKKFLCLKISEIQCNTSLFTQIFSEIGEILVHSTYENICIDLSSLPIVTSLMFGVCINIVSAAKVYRKKLKFRFDASAMETVKLASFDALAEIEQVQKT
jgi:hypothetical protein